ncbi:MAG: DUF4301 family protein [Cyclobacteriaceae bacterium]|nr:DUF4301 family protein [Cyclobacteriaceae bacterium]
MFTENDLKQIQQRGSQPETVEQQLKYFQQGFPFLPVVKAATPGDGLLSLDSAGCKRYEDYYISRFAGLDVVKFVPASGAASRMFKSLFTTLEEYDGTDTAYEKIISDQGFQSVWNFFKSIEKFAFFEELKQVHQQLHQLTLEESLLRRDYAKVLTSLLGEEGMNYGNLPKGLLQFHRYDDGSRTALEEHLVEGANYCHDKNGVVRLHFTVSPEHREKFMARIAEVKDKFEQKFNVSYKISFSEQKSSTDTIAVNPDNSPFREDNGELLFRPAGHGALIENLNDIDADIIFIKNIDNVVPDHLKDETYRYKRVIAGVLLEYQEKIHAYLNQIDHGDVSPDLLEEIQSFMQNKLCIEDIPQIEDEQKLIDFFYQKLNRPVRVCGMVKNEGEPGGGPFFARNADGTVSLQIAECSQIDMHNPEVKGIAASATHFNPVDLVCSVKDHLGNKYALGKFVDPQTGFISVKSKSGKELKALELPGLWNGAMSDWNTLFVEVPIVTFNPVKTVNDLLRDQHQ